MIETIFIDINARNLKKCPPPAGYKKHTITRKAPVGANKMIQRSLALNVAQYE